MASRRCPFSTPPDPPGLLELSSSSAFFGCRPNFHKQIRQHFLASTQSDTSPRLPFDLFLSEQKRETLITNQGVKHFTYGPKPDASRYANSPASAPRTVAYTFSHTLPRLANCQRRQY